MSTLPYETETFYSGSLRITRPASGYRRPMISFDKTLTLAYDDQVLNNRQASLFPIAPISAIIYHEQAKKEVFIQNLLTNQTVLIGQTNYKSSFVMTFKSDSIDTRVQLSIITDSRTPETSSSSPSFIYHQLCSAVLLSSVTGGRMVFEDTTVRGTPDITYINKVTMIHIDITTEFGIQEKMKSYKQICAINKYLLLKTLFNYSESSYLGMLETQSQVNDQLNTSYITNKINQQNVSRQQSIYSADVAHFFNTTPESTLNDLQQVFKGAILKRMSERPDQMMMPHENQFPIHHFEVNLASKFSLFDFKLNRKRENVTTEVDDQINLIIRNDELQIDGEQNHFSTFYKRSSDQILIDRKAYDKLIKYRESKIGIQLKSENDYYSQCKSEFSQRSGDYFMSKSRASANWDRETGSYKEKKAKTIRNLNKIIPVDAYLMHNKVESLADIVSLLYDSEQFPIDPIHLEIINMSLKNNDRRALLIDLLSRSKVYHLLNLYSKLAQALLYGISDGTCITVEHPFLNISLNAYVSGSATETDKGVTYVSLVCDGKLMKTYLWRPSDLKSYKIANSRLISVILGSWLKVSDNRKLQLLTTYSLIILENSWGLSKVLKPYRYYVMSHVFNSPKISSAALKVSSAVLEMHKMSSNKLSLIFMSLITKTDPVIPGLSPLFKFKLEDSGFEMFLMNLCPSSTYGKRRHQVNVLNELAKEIDLADESIANMKQWNGRFLTVCKDILNANPINKERFATKYLTDFDSYTNMQGGRFSYSPLSILLIYPFIRKLAKNTKPVRSAKPLDQLTTMKASFDPLSFKNCTALTSLSNLSMATNCPTTSMNAIYLLSKPLIDLTFRMFDKDQIGGDREISIMSSEFRILQSITEEFARKYGERTQVDMLSNSRKIEILSDYQNQCTRNQGIRETIDQTRWGPNFNTTIFGYMYLIFNRYTTEAHVPMMTCFLSEYKIFQMLTYPELSAQQKTGYTLPGRMGQCHMGQGIFHYTSSLYHSLVASFLCDLRTEIVPPNPNYSLASKPLVTSDDCCIFSYLQPKIGYVIPEHIRTKTMELVKRHIGNYSWVVSLFCIKTSEYKNASSESSVEFNSIFLHTDSVGTNSLKFLYSLQDPYTSGNKLRDLRSIFDSYSDGINSGLNEYEARVLLLSKLSNTMLLWNSSSYSILKLLKMLDSELKTSLDILRCTTRTIALNSQSLLESPTVLPYKTYKEASESIDLLIRIEPRFEIRSMYELKKETLSKAKQRRLGSNKGVVMSRKMRSECLITLPVGKPIPAVTISPGAYLSTLMLERSERGLVDPRTTQTLAPFETYIDQPSGFSMRLLKFTKGIRLTSHELLVSSYDRVSSVDNTSSSLDVYLHMMRKYKVVRILDERINCMNFNERIRHFDDVTSEARLSGNCALLEYNKVTKVSTNLVFPFPSDVMTMVPSMILSRTEDNLLAILPAETISYKFGVDNKRNRISSSTISGPSKSVKLISSETFEPDLDSFYESALWLMTTDIEFQSSRDLFFEITISVIMKPGSESTQKSIEISGHRIDLDMIPEEQLSEIARKLEKLGYNIEGNYSQESDESDEQNQETEQSDIDYDMLFSQISGIKIQRKVVCVRVPYYMKFITQGWFVNGVIENGILLSLIKQGFVQNTSKTEPEQILYSINKGIREPSNSFMVNHDGSRYSQLCLSTFPIPETISKLSEGITLHEKYCTDHRRLELLFDFASDLESFDMCLLGNLPSGSRITEESDALLVDFQEMFELIRDLKSQENIPLDAGIQEPALRTPEESVFPERWADYED